MTSRRSSGSMRAESAVEPTRSENITVTWRRSAVSWRLRLRPGGGLRCCGGCACQLANGREHFPPMPEQDADIFEVLIGQMSGVPQTLIPFSAKRWAYSDMPRFLSQSAISCIAAPSPDLTWPDRASGPGQWRVYLTNSRRSTPLD